MPFSHTSFISNYCTKLSCCVFQPPTVAIISHSVGLFMVLSLPWWPSVSHCMEYVTNKPSIKPVLNIRWSVFHPYFCYIWSGEWEVWHWVAFWTISHTTYSFFSSPLYTSVAADLSFHSHPHVDYNGFCFGFTVFITISTQQYVKR
jgi:hypothetical protein